MINIFASLLLSLSVNAASVPTFTSCSGVPYTPDPEWNMEVSFLDEFNGTVLDETKWSIIEGDLGFNAESQVYTNSSLSVADGKLAITAGYNPSGGETPYTSGRIDTQGKYAFQYGVFEACVKFPEVKGLWPAAWLLGNKYNGSNTEANGWPDCGEIDVLEYQTAWNKDGKTTTLTTLHTAANNSGNGITQGVPLDNPSEYHLYAVDRKYDSIVFYRDGQVVCLGIQLAI